MRNDFDRLDLKDLWTDRMAFFGLAIGIIGAIGLVLVLMLLEAIG